MRPRIASKEISPVELLDQAIGQMAEINPAVNAIIGGDVPQARRQAWFAENAVRRGEALSLLHGLLTGIKDLPETKDLLTT